MDIDKLTKELQNAQGSYTSKLVDFHTLALVPKVEDKVMVAAIEYYTMMVNDYLKLIGDFDEHYRGRNEVKATIVKDLLNISEKVEKMLDKYMGDFDAKLPD